MKVTLFRDMEAEGWCSMERYADSLSQQFRISNFDLRIFSAEPPLKSSKIRKFWRNYVYPNLGRFFQGDVNHILDHSYAHLLKFLDPGKTVVTCHDLIPLFFEKDPEVLRKFEATVRNLAKAPAIIADSLATKRDLEDKLSITAELIEVIYLGVDPIFRPLSSDQIQEIKKRYSLPDGKIIMNHGNNLIYKNVEGMLRAFREVIKVNDRSYFVRVGPVPLTVNQMDLVNQLGISHNFYEIINPTDEDLVGIYNCADVFLSPSFKEGFGLTVLQSLACGVPVVVSKGTSLEEIAGDVGVYVDPASVEEITKAILFVFNKESPAVKDKESLIRRASGFTWEKTARETLGVYNRVLEGLPLKEG